ncbi:MAG: NAD-dependent deacetylase [Proteobacteria bacterium]|nr:NAD-dependent deacetylase [Pseudomonadota bacterium]
MNNIQLAAKAIQNASSMVITAGAGMGVDSGLPDFRGDEGFWAYYPSLYGHSFSDMANPKWFEEDPFLAWGFYGHRLNLYRETVPHEGFSILKNWAQSLDFFIFTSNVDGQFQKSGFDPDRIVECHGSIHWMQHTDGKGDEIWDGSDVLISVDRDTLRAYGDLPNRNGKIIRPNILMFGDWSWLSGRSDQQSVLFSSWLQDKLEQGSSNLEGMVVIEMGAGTSIPTVRRQGERLQSAGATLIRINPRESYGPKGTLSIPCGAKEGLQKIEELLKQ